MKLTAYLRVSTDRQAEEGLGLEIQERAIRKWAKTHGHKVIAVHKDEGISGSNGLDTRIGLADALEDARSGAADALAVYRLDRLARDLIVQETLLAEVKRMGKQVVSTSASEDAYLVDDPDDPSRKLIRQVLGAVSEYERSMIALRLKAGRARKAEKGGYAHGAPPFGYRADGGELVPDETEYPALRRMLELHAEGLSTRKIAARLEAEGHRPKRAECFSSATIAAIIRRRITAEVLPCAQ